MKTTVMTAALAVAIAAPGAALAKPHHHDHDGWRGKGHPHGMPPGQAKKHWSRGEYMPRGYVVERTYYIAEPARYRLRTPPPGYRWVRVGNDVYLAQTETGLIAEVIRSLID